MKPQRCERCGKPALGDIAVGGVWHWLCAKCIPLFVDDHQAAAVDPRQLALDLGPDPLGVETVIPRGEYL